MIGHMSTWIIARCCMCASHVAGMHSNGRSAFGSAGAVLGSSQTKLRNRSNRSVSKDIDICCQGPCAELCKESFRRRYLHGLANV